MPRLIAALLCSTSLQACSTPPPVAPWEKGTLARPEMGFDRSGVDTRYDAHIYTSREGTPASQGVGGGGCGCN